MEGNIAATYILIFRFLKQQSQHKAAEAVKKAAKPIVVLRDDIGQEGPPLEDIIKEWKTKGNTKSNVASSSADTDFSEESSSDSDESSGSDPSSEDASAGSESESDIGGSNDSSGHSDEATAAKKLSTKASERVTSAKLSSAAENSREAVGQAIQVSQIPKEKSSKNKNDSSESDSSDLDDSSKSSAADSSDAESSSSSPGSSSNSDPSNEDERNANGKIPSHSETTKDKGPSTSESGSDSDDGSNSESQPKEDTCVAKKRKTSKNGVAVTTAVAVRSQQIARAPQRKERHPPKVKERFQRVKVQNLAPELLLNNGFEARGAAANDYGERAHRDLIVTRGAEFRKEKNKKKRGSYRGGEITMESHSIKFDF